MLRTPITLDPIDLASASQQRRRFATLGAVGIGVSVRIAAGVNATRTYELKRCVGGRADAFDSAKTIAAGGGTVQVSADELAGVEELELVTVGSAESGMNRVLVTVTYESEEGTPMAASGVGAIGSVRDLLGGGGSSVKLEAPPLE